MRYIPLRIFDAVMPGYRTQQFLDEFLWMRADWSKPENRATFARCADAIAECKEEVFSVSDEDHEKISVVLAAIDLRAMGITNTQLSRPLRTIINSILDAPSKYKPPAKTKPKDEPKEEAPAPNGHS